jgi:hypothetical protein
MLTPRPVEGSLRTPTALGEENLYNREQRDDERNWVHVLSLQKDAKSL